MNARSVQSTPSPSLARGWLQQLVESQVTRTPCFIYDERKLHELLERGVTVASTAGVNLLYTLKPFSLSDFLKLISSNVEGFAVSSLFEARLAREVTKSPASVHFTSPGLRPADLQELSECCDYISFNSVSQWHRFSTSASRTTSCGLRVNPQYSLVSDPRYDPCRLHSKLGTPLNDLAEAYDSYPAAFRLLKGLHFHTNCDATEFCGLLETAQIIDAKLDKLLSTIDWINLGGGYLFEEGKSIRGLIEAAALFKSKYDLNVFIEPGAALIREAGFIVSSVLDCFEASTVEARRSPFLTLP